MPNAELVILRVLAGAENLKVRGQRRS